MTDTPEAVAKAIIASLRPTAPAHRALYDERTRRCDTAERQIAQAIREAAGKGSGND